MRGKMRRSKNRISIILAVILCVSLIPFGVFADSDAAQPVSAAETAAETSAVRASAAAEETSPESSDSGFVTGIGAEQSGTDQNSNTDNVNKEDQPEQTDAEGAADPADHDVTPEPVRTKEFSLDGYSLRVRSFDVLAESPLGNSYKPKAVICKMIKAGGRKITWTAAKNDAKLDGYIVLRNKKGADQYVEVAVKAAGKTSCTDKKATSRDTGKYSYIVVGYRTEGEAVRISHCSSAGFKRVYQNPSKYVQIKDKISKHGLKYYTSPVLTDASCTRKEHIEAMIKTAYKYKGDRYVVCQSGKPGKGLDCSGLVMQACYGAGVDLWPSNPARHKLRKYEYESRNIAKMKSLKTVSFSKRKRGDLIFFANSAGTVIHVAIYLGNDRIIHSTSVGMRVIVSGMGGGAYGRICKVKRVFV